MPARSKSPGDRRTQQDFSEFARSLLTRGPNGGRSWIVCAGVDSTNALARRYLDRVRGQAAGVPESCCFVAWEQTAGRARNGRTWESAAGLGLYQTLLLPDLPAPLVPMLPLLTACAVARVVSPLTATEVRIKWPNDILSSGRKLAGILVETATRAGELASAIVGIGLNCHHAAGELPLPTATSLRLEGADPIDSAALAHDLCAEIDRRLGAGLSMSAVVEEYRSLTVHRLGDRVRHRQRNRVVEGRFAGVGDDGSLLLEQDGRIEPIRAGEIVES